MPYVHDYWLTDVHGVVRGSRLRAQYDDDALAAERQRVALGATPDLAGCIYLMRDDGVVIDTWDGPAKVLEHA